MKPNEYLVIFKTGEREKVYAFSEKDARVLAQAKQIEKGNRYDIEKVICIDENKFLCTIRGLDGKEIIVQLKRTM